MSIDNTNCLFKDLGRGDKDLLFTILKEMVHYQTINEDNIPLYYKALLKYPEIYKNLKSINGKYF